MRGWLSPTGGTQDAILGVLRKRSQRGAAPMEAGKGKSSDFRLSQALANPPSQKGAIRSFILYGLSPPVSEGEVAGPHISFPDHRSLRKTHLPHQLRKPWVGTDGIDCVISLQTYQTLIMLLKRGVEPLEK